MAEIGKPERIIEIEPLKAPSKEPEEPAAPAEPTKQPEKIPANASALY